MLCIFGIELASRLSGPDVFISQVPGVSKEGIASLGEIAADSLLTLSKIVLRATEDEGGRTVFHCSMGTIVSPILLVSNSSKRETDVLSHAIT